MCVQLMSRESISLKVNLSAPEVMPKPTPVSTLRFFTAAIKGVPDFVELVIQRKEVAKRAVVIAVLTIRRPGHICR